MAKYSTKPMVIDAARWFRNGDHPEDNCDIIDIGDGPLFGEGHVVRRYCRLEHDGQDECRYCGKTMCFHGWIDTIGGGHIVCPGDWIIERVKGEFYPCKPDIFAITYELSNE